MNMFFNKKKKALGYSIGGLDGYGEVEFVSNLPKPSKLSVKTQEPKDRIDIPYTNPSMGYITDYWSTKRCRFNYDLYLKIVRAKN